LHQAYLDPGILRIFSWLFLSFCISWYYFLLYRFVLKQASLIQFGRWPKIITAFNWVLKIVIHVLLDYILRWVQLILLSFCLLFKDRQLQMQRLPCLSKCNQREGDTVLIVPNELWGVGRNNSLRQEKILPTQLSTDIIKGHFWQNHYKNGLNYPLKHEWTIFYIKPLKLMVQLFSLYTK
jgi:hypothetical protein